MSSSVWALQRAIYNALRDDAVIQQKLGSPARVFDDPPADAAFPYLTIGETRIRDWPGVQGGVEHDIRLHAFSRYAGRREIKEILNAVYDALHDAILPLQDNQLVNIRFVFGDAFRRNDGETYQGVVRFRAVTQPA